MIGMLVYDIANWNWPRVEKEKLDFYKIPNNRLELSDAHSRYRIYIAIAKRLTRAVDLSLLRKNVFKGCAKMVMI